MTRGEGGLFGEGRTLRVTECTPVQMAARGLAGYSRVLSGWCEKWHDEFFG